VRARRGGLGALVALAAAVALLAGCGGGDDGATTGAGAGTAPAERVSLVLDWFPNANHAGVYGALQEGLFAAEGVDVRPRVPADPTTTLKEVAAGKADLGVSYQPEVLIARSQGLPVRAVGALVVHPLNSVMARTDRGITRPRDLEGKTVGIAGVPSDRALLDTVVRDDGGDPARVKTRVVGFSLAPALAAGRVDAVIGAYWNVEQVDLARKGVPTTVFRLEEHGVPDYDELVLVTSDRTARERPEMLRAVLAGLARGQRWARENPGAAAASLVAANPDLDAADLPEQLRLTLPLLSPDDEPPLTVDVAEWTAFATWMRERGLLQEPVDAADAVTPEFLPAGDGR
jgi:putative hydroxymethylpyrimidine transport system substrate-binding protein